MELQTPRRPKKEGAGRLFGRRRFGSVKTSDPCSEPAPQADQRMTVKLRDDALDPGLTKHELFETFVGFHEIEVREPSRETRLEFQSLNLGLQLVYLGDARCFHIRPPHEEPSRARVCDHRSPLGSGCGCLVDLSL
jgi:hypothetical protein